MSKKLFGFTSIFIALFLGALYYSHVVQAPFLSALNQIKSTYFHTIEFIEDKIYQHTFQAKHIAQLNEKLIRYENNHLVMRQLASEIHDLFTENHSRLKSLPNVQLVRAISYAKFGDVNRVWLEIPEYNASKVYGLTYKELVAGIVIPQNNKPLALLNRDVQSSYSVYVGDAQAPGIAHGNNAKYLIVKFIPAWFTIHKGDEVITSGLDELFFKGLKVGKVISLNKSQGYQNAIIEPYYEAHDLNYFHIIKNIR